jgi:hypothetical protein
MQDRVDLAVKRAFCIAERVDAASGTALIQIGPREAQVVGRPEVPRSFDLHAAASLNLQLRMRKELEYVIEAHIPLS